jgi:hypothetical protein
MDLVLPPLDLGYLQVVESQRVLLLLLHPALDVRDLKEPGLQNLVHSLIYPIEAVGHQLLKLRLTF